jgi:hypothetical protein
MNDADSRLGISVIGCFVMNINAIDETILNEFLSTRGSSFLTHQDRENILSYVFVKDQIRSFISLLLQKYVIKKKYGFVSSMIQRTREVILNIFNISVSSPSLFLLF